MFETFNQIIAYAKTICIRSLCGIAGALMLMVAFPPVKNNHFQFATFLQRVFSGAILSIFMGPWLLEILATKLPDLLLHKYPELIFFALGAIGYFMFRWLAIWLNRNKDKAIDELDIRLDSHER